MHDLIRASGLQGYDELVAALGGDPQRLRARFGLPPEPDEPDTVFVPFDAYIGLIETTATELSCADFGLRLGLRQGLSVLGPVAVVARNCGTVREGIAEISRFMPVHSPALRLVVHDSTSGAGMRLGYQVVRRPPYDLQQAYELAMATAVQIVGVLSGGVAGPATIWFPHPRIGPATSYEQALGCPVVFESDGCGLSVAQEVLERPVDAADPQTLRLARAYLESRYPEAGAPLSRRVAELIRRLLPTGRYGVEVVADQLHLHPRTLQRRLAQEGVTYADLLDEQRRALVERYLSEPDLQVGQIATQLGYTEQSAFNRAFRRWYDTSPREFRAAQRWPSA